MDFRSPINLQLPEVPAGIPDELVPTIQGIYSALRNLQISIGDLTGASFLDPTYFGSLAPAPSASIQIQNLTAVYLEASTAISAGLLFSLANVGGVVKAGLASAAAIGTRAWGFCPLGVDLGTKGLFSLWEGINGNYAGLTPGQTYYLSSTSPGGITAVKPSASGTIVQEVGLALSATELAIRLSTPIVNP